MTDNRNIYVAVRAKCRSLGLSMATATAVVDAFHARHLFSLADVARAVATEAGAVKESKSDHERKGDVKASTQTPGAEALVARASVLSRCCCAHSLTRRL